MIKPRQFGNKLKLGVVSGYFDPLHSGHLNYINNAKKLCDMLFVIVNSDYQAKLKKKKSFLDEDTRVDIISNLRAVDFTLKSIDKDRSVIKTLKLIHATFKNIFNIVFANGGDVDINNLLEKNICKELNIEMIFNVGGKKIQSSSEIIKRYGEKI